MPHPFTMSNDESDSRNDEPESETHADTADLRMKYHEKVRECHRLKQQLDNSVRKEQEVSRQLREKQVILDYLERKLFDQKTGSGFMESTPVRNRPEFFLPGVTPIYPPFSRPPAHYQAGDTMTQKNELPQSGVAVNSADQTSSRNHFTLSPSRYRLPLFGGSTDMGPAGEADAQRRRRVDSLGEPLDFRKRQCMTPTASTMVMNKTGNGSAPIVIEEVFPELSGMCKPFVRICLVGGTKSFFCVHPNCKGRELNGNVWRKHYTSHFPDPDCVSPYHCPKCNQGFDLYRPLSKHFPGCGVTEVQSDSH